MVWPSIFWWMNSMLNSSVLVHLLSLQVIISKNACERSQSNESIGSKTLYIRPGHPEILRDTTNET